MDENSTPEFEMDEHSQIPNDWRISSSTMEDEEHHHSDLAAANLGNGIRDSEQLCEEWDHLTESDFFGHNADQAAANLRYRIRGSDQLLVEWDHTTESDYFDHDASELFTQFDSIYIETPRIFHDFIRAAAEMESTLTNIADEVAVINKAENEKKAEGSAISFTGGLLGIAGTVAAPFSLGSSLVLTAAGVYISWKGSSFASKAEAKLTEKMNRRLGEYERLQKEFNGLIVQWVPISVLLSEIVEELEDVFSDLSFSFGHLLKSLEYFRCDDSSPYQVECILKCFSNFYGVAKTSTHVVKSCQKITELTIHTQYATQIIKAAEGMKAMKNGVLRAAIGKSRVAKQVAASGGQVVSTVQKASQVTQVAKQVATSGNQVVSTVQKASQVTQAAKQVAASGNQVVSTMQKASQVTQAAKQVAASGNQVVSTMQKASQVTQAAKQVAASGNQVVSTMQKASQVTQAAKQVAASGNQVVSTMQKASQVTQAAKQVAASGNQVVSTMQKASQVTQAAKQVAASGNQVVSTVQKASQVTQAAKHVAASGNQVVSTVQKASQVTQAATSVSKQVAATGGQVVSTVPKASQVTQAATSVSKQVVATGGQVVSTVQKASQVTQAATSVSKQVAASGGQVASTVQKASQVSKTATSVSKQVASSGKQVVSTVQKANQASETAKLTKVTIDSTGNIVKSNAAIETSLKTVSRETTTITKSVCKLGLALGVVFAAIDLYQYDNALTASKATCDAEKELRSSIENIKTSTKEIMGQLMAYQQVIKIKKLFEYLLEIDAKFVFGEVDMPLEKVRFCLDKIKQLESSLESY